MAVWFDKNVAVWPGSNALRFPPSPKVTLAAVVEQVKPLLGTFEFSVGMPVLQSCLHY